MYTQILYLVMMSIKMLHAKNIWCVENGVFFRSEYSGAKNTMWLVHGWQEEGGVWDSTKDVILAVRV